MEPPESSDSEDGSVSENVLVLPDDFEEEVDIDIHFHCEHCFKINKCIEWPKIGWSCEIIKCKYGCQIRFHECKRDEHELMCSHMKVPCLNQNNGCPCIMQRRQISQHLQSCPASVIVCNAEWNRWALGARDREKVIPPAGFSSQYNTNDIDMAVALEDQRMVNQLQSQFKQLKTVSSGIAPRKCPSLPIKTHGTIPFGQHETNISKGKSTQTTTEEDEENLTPGLSFSVCSSLLREGNVSDGLRRDLLPTSGSVETRCQTNDDISARCCSHGIMKDICNFCKNDPEQPNFTIGYVWREKLDPNTNGQVIWVKEPRVEKLRKRGPMDRYAYRQVEDSDEEEEKAAIVQHCCGKDGLGAFSTLPMRFGMHSPGSPTYEGLSLELALKDYSRHQQKPKAMFTFQCLKELRRDQFCGHYQNIHCEIREGLDGWIVERCPMYTLGCPFIVQRLFPGPQDGKLVYSSHLKSFGVKKTTSNLNISECNTNGHSSSLTLDDRGSLSFLHLPTEILQKIAMRLDGYTLNNLSLTCRYLRDICESLLTTRGLVIQEWRQCIQDNNITWKVGDNRWFFSTAFDRLDKWRFDNSGDISNHLEICQYNIRNEIQEKFCYTAGLAEEVKKHRQKIANT